MFGGPYSPRINLISVRVVSFGELVLLYQLFIFFNQKYRFFTLDFFLWIAIYGLYLFPPI